MNTLYGLVVLFVLGGGGDVSYVASPIEYETLDDCDYAGSKAKQESDAKGYGMVGYICADTETVAKMVTELDGVPL